MPSPLCCTEAIFLQIDFGKTVKLVSLSKVLLYWCLEKLELQFVKDYQLFFEKNIKTIFLVHAPRFDCVFVIQFIKKIYYYPAI